jgi:rod shape determining protein RodA
VSFKEKIHIPFWRNLDVVTFCICMGLAFIGWLLVYRVGGSEDDVEQAGSFLATSAGKQTMWMILAMALFWLTMLFDPKFWETFAYGFYTAAMVGLILVLFLGSNIKGATSWFSFGGMTFQPSEVAKFATCLAVSAFLGRFNTNLEHFRSQLVAFGLILLPIFLILMQPDPGSALVFFSFLFVFYRQGLSPTLYLIGAFVLANLIAGFVFDTQYITLGLLSLGLIILGYSTTRNHNSMGRYNKRQNWAFGLAGVAVGGLAYWQYELPADFGPLIAAVLLFGGLGTYLWMKEKQGKLFRLLTFAVLFGTGVAFMAHYTINNVLKPHQQARIKLWLTPEECDPHGPRYNLEQSKLAISSGGWDGKGLFKGTMTRLDYVPEQTTDFIFSTVGEEQGFIGSVSIIVLYLVLLFRLTTIAERQRTTFARCYAYCVAGIFFVHFFINIGMTMGLMPIIGIPLPFISKGGSSLLGFTIMIAVLLRLDSTRKRDLGNLAA